jgi:hypothetical protein
LEVNTPYVKTIEIAGFASALQAMRLPLKSGDRSDSSFFNHSAVLELDNDREEYYDIYSDIYVGSKDLKLLQNLVRKGNEHAKVIRGIIVWAEFNMPRYMWQEIDTYTIGMAPLSSESSMHCEAKGLSDDELVEFKENLKEGHLQKRIRAFSYQALRNMEFQRHNHRLPLWREVICPWIESLPLANELITINPWWMDKINELESKIEGLQCELREEQN